MESMPPMERTQLAAKDDLALTARELGVEMGELRAEVHELRGDMRNEFADMKRWTVFYGLGLAVSTWAVTITAIAVG